jgi:gamma-glutamyltranspeptidase / glutathione hydrolase
MTPPRLRRSVSVAQNGMVATSHPLAAQIGLEILKKGGNAVDAAIATSAAMGLMEPTSCGIGGDLYAIIFEAETQKLFGLNASGRAPIKATLEYFHELGLEQIPSRGPLSWSVPGCVDGWDQLRVKFGTMSFQELLEPSIEYAEQGVAVPEVIAEQWKAAEDMTDAGMRETFLIRDADTNDLRAPAVGEMFRNPALANSYRLISKYGRDAFYQGPIAESLVALSDQVGGLFTVKDFANHTSEWVEPVHVSYRGYDVWEIPPPSQGIAALQMLNLLEPHDLKAMGPLSADYWHLLVESKKIAFADRAKYYADPLFASVPVKELISKEYSAQRAALFDTHTARTDIAAGDPKLSTSETIYLTVVDQHRNCISLIQSNYKGFGSGLSAPGTGFGIQNRGCLFALDENHANRLESGKRPFHTIIPAMVTKDGRPFFSFGVMGGDMQVQGHVQILVNLLDFGMNVQSAGDAPRVEHTGHPTPTGISGAANGGTILAEEGIPENVVQDLVARGHVVERVDINVGGYQGILIDPKTNVLHGGSESRKDGMAVGY